MKLSFAAVLLLALCARAFALPFWTEKSSYVEGDYLYAVGIASNAEKEEAAREKAFDNGVRELKNYLLSDNLDGITIETQMTHTERHKDGTVTVYRLLRAPLSKIGKARPRRGDSPFGSAGPDYYDSEMRALSDKVLAKYSESVSSAAKAALAVSTETYGRPLPATGSELGFTGARKPDTPLTPAERAALDARYSEIAGKLDKFRRNADAEDAASLKGRPGGLARRGNNLSWFDDPPESMKTGIFERSRREEALAAQLGVSPEELHWFRLVRRRKALAAGYQAPASTENVKTGGERRHAEIP